MDTVPSRQQEFVLHTLTERDIAFVQLWFTDILGHLKSVSVAPTEIPTAFEEGVGFDGSAIEGFARLHEADMIAIPDPSTFQVLEPEEASARIFCDVVTPTGEAALTDPRHVLRRSVERAAALGFTPFAHTEMEFFLFDDLPEEGGEPHPIDQGGYFDHTTHVRARDFRRRAVLALEQLGISVEFSHHECAPGQQEIDLRMADVLSTADNVMTFRHLMREIARDDGVCASFMPKPFSDQPGSGMHTHLSLFSREGNAFYDADDSERLSVVGRRFLAGVLHHARELSAVTNQWVNSYKRLFAAPLLPNHLAEAPTTVSWGAQNLSALVRVPAFGKDTSARIEVRSPDPACNPYLALAALISAGLEGVEREYVLPEPGEGASSVSLPHTLAEALDVLEASELMRRTLGESLLEYFLANKRVEVREYRRYITPFERQRYLTL